MIKATITTPTICYLEAPKDELDKLVLNFQYKRKSDEETLRRLKDADWLKRKDPDGWKIQVLTLQANLQKDLIFEKDGKYHTYTGLALCLPDLGYQIEYNTSQNIIPKINPMPWKVALPFVLRHEQAMASNNMMNRSHANVELPTGFGKTAVMLHLARELGLRGAIVTPSRSIFGEILEKFEHHLGKNNIGCIGDGKRRIGNQITICISDSLCNIKKDTDEWKFFSNLDYVISDESHQLASDTLEIVFHNLFAKVPRRYFVSGTQIREDGTENLLKAIIGPNVLKMTTREAISKQYISPIKVRILSTNKNNNMFYKDPIKNKRKHFLENTNIADLSAMIANSAWSSKQESTLILVSELSQIKLLAERLKVPFEYAHSASKKDALLFGLEKVDSAAQVEKFNMGKCKVLIGTSCIAVGTNIYPTHNTINWVGGGSEVSTRQGAIGRSVRILGESKYKDMHKPKPFCTIYDFDIRDNIMLNKQLSKRMVFYRDATDDVVVVTKK